MNIYQESIETLYEIKDNITDEEFDILQRFSKKCSFFMKMIKKHM